MPNELVDERLVKRMCEESLLSPQLDYLYMLYARQMISVIRQLSALILWERLGHFLSVLCEPVPLTVLTLQFKLLFNDLVYLLFLWRIKPAN